MLLCAACLPLVALARFGASLAGRQEGQRTPVLPQQLARAADATDSGLAFVELGAARDTFLLGEPFVLRLRFGLERELLGTSLVQLFQRPLDVPAQVFAPALELLDGAQFLDAGEPAAGATFALGERITRATRAADEERAGRTYAVFEYERRVTGTRPGELRLPAPLLGFARATRFEDDFELGRVPLDRHDELVRGSGTSLTISPLPEDGRPAEFTGAIGRYTIRARAEPRELAAGSSLALTVEIEAEGDPGDLAQASAPSLEGLDGFHVRGSLLEREPLRLTARYDLVPRDAGVTEIPPIRFAFFDVTPPAGYRTIETQPIALRVHPAAVEPKADAPASAAEPAPSRSAPWLAPVVLVVLALGAWLLRRRARAS